jgi:hypothetical protein
VGRLVLRRLSLPVPALVEFGFDPKCERDYNIFNPLRQYRPDYPLDPINGYNPSTPFQPLNRSR